MKEENPCRLCILTTDQFSNVVGCFVEIFIVVHEKQMWASNVVKDLTILWFLGVWADTDDDNTGTFPLKNKIKRATVVNQVSYLRKKGKYV